MATKCVLYSSQDVKGLSPMERGCIRTKIMENSEFVNFKFEYFNISYNSTKVSTWKIEACQGTFPWWMEQTDR